MSGKREEGGPAVSVWRHSSAWFAASAETAGGAAVAVVLAGGLVAGGLTTMAVVASRTLDAAPRPQAGVSVAPTPTRENR